MIRRGSPSLRPTAVADTASGGATIAPRVSAGGKGQVRHRLECDERRPRTSSPTADRRPAARSGADVLQSDIAALQARRPQQRRQQDVEHELGFEFDVGEPGDGARHQAGDHQRKRRRHVEAARERGQQDRQHQHREQGPAPVHLLAEPRSSRPYPWSACARDHADANRTRRPPDDMPASLGCNLRTRARLLPGSARTAPISARTRGRICGCA